MLKQYRQIDIEFQSYCNRKCPWCPNAFIDRQNTNNIMDKKLFTDIIQQIEDNNFALTNHSKLKLSKTISFKGFMEPMSNIDLFKEYINICHSILSPNIFLEASTNGDYLTKKNLDGLFLHQLNIMDYDCKGEAWWTNKMQSLNCAFIHPTTKNEKLSFIHESVNLIQISLNWPKEHKIENRAGVLDETLLSQYHVDFSTLRTLDCPEMEYYLSITHNGFIMPCCHMRDDIEHHKPYIMGDLKQQKITDILTNEKFLFWKSQLENKKCFKGMPGICDYCNKTRQATLKYANNGYCYHLPMEKRKNDK